jgi:hypothetical protein
VTAKADAQVAVKVGFGALRWPEHAGFLFEQTGGDQPRGSRVLSWAAESVAGAFFARLGERAVQQSGGGLVEWLAVVSQAAGDFRLGRKNRPFVDVMDTNHSGGT